MDWNTILSFIAETGLVQFLLGLWTGHRKRAKTNATLMDEIPNIDKRQDDMSAKLDAISDGMKEVMHSELDALAFRIIKQGYSTEGQISRLDDIYHSYHEGLHGNGSGTKIYEQARGLPIKETEE